MQFTLGAIRAVEEATARQVGKGMGLRMKVACNRITPED